MQPGSVLGVVTMVPVGRGGVGIPTWATHFSFHLRVQTGLRAHSPPSSSELKNERRYSSTIPCACAQGQLHLTAPCRIARVWGALPNQCMYVLVAATTGPDIGRDVTMSVCCELGSGRSRDGLKLALNRSLSEPGPPDLPSSNGFLVPPKRCKLESVSLPASPCSESATLQRSLVMKKVKPLDPDSLVRKLQRSSTGCGGKSNANRNFLVVDCRPFIAYNVNHIRGSINVNCSDRFNRKRLQQGKATLADLATTREGKDLLKKRTYKEVVVYDDCTTDFDRLPTSHPLFLVLTTLVEDNRDPAFLLGKLASLMLSCCSPY